MVGPRGWAVGPGVGGVSGTWSVVNLYRGEGWFSKWIRLGLVHTCAWSPRCAWRDSGGGCPHICMSILSFRDSGSPGAVYESDVAWRMPASHSAWRGPPCVLDSLRSADQVNECYRDFSPT